MPGPGGRCSNRSMALRMRRHLAEALPLLVVEPVPARLRAYVDGDPVLDTARGVLVWEPRRIVPMYAAPETDLRLEVKAAEPQPVAPSLDTLPPVLGPDSFEPHTSP